MIAFELMQPRHGLELLDASCVLDQGEGLAHYVDEHLSVRVAVVLDHSTVKVAVVHYDSIAHWSGHNVVALGPLSYGHFVELASVHGIGNCPKAARWKGDTLYRHLFSFVMMRFLFHSSMDLPL